jgi:hypothetical protein
MRTSRRALHVARQSLTSERRARSCTRGVRSSARARPRCCAAGVLRRPPQCRDQPQRLAATLVLTIAAVFLYGLNNRVEALAAQLAVDHVKCFQFVPDHSTVDPGAAGLAWARTQGWALRVPSSAPDRQLVLLDVRRCWSTDGITAHMLYRWRGEPLSVYVLNGVPARSFEVRTVDKLGQEEIMWSRGGRTYAIVARGRRADLQQVVAYVQQSVE